MQIRQGVSLLERLTTAWRTLRDDEQAGLLLRGPLPLWMQETFEREAERRGIPVGSVIFDTLSDAAREMLAEATTQSKGKAMNEEKIHKKRVQVFEAMEPLHKIASEWRDDPDPARQAIFHLCHVVATQTVLIGALVAKMEERGKAEPGASDYTA